MIKNFDRNNLKSLREELQSAVLSVAQKHNITIVVGNASFFPERATIKVEMVTKGTGATAGADPQMVKYEADFKRTCTLFGLKPEQWGAKLTFGRESYKLVGLKPKAPKRPVLAQGLHDGRVYILPESALASIQSEEYKKRYGIQIPQFKLGGTLKIDTDALNNIPQTLCSNEHAFDLKGMQPRGKCTNPATTHRKEGFGKNTKQVPYCDECAHLIDESRAEMEAEARANR